MDGIDTAALESIIGGDVDYIAINKLAIDHADAIVAATDDVPAELIEYAQASGKPFLPFLVLKIRKPTPTSTIHSDTTHPITCDKE